MGSSALTSHRRALWPILLSSIVCAGCSPLGWYDAPPPRYAPPQQQATPPPPNPGATSPQQTPPDARRAPAQAPKKASIQVVETGRQGTYYVIDRTRGLCFFHNGGAMARIDCNTLPEARDVTPPAPTREPSRTDGDKKVGEEPPAPPMNDGKTDRTFEGSKRGHSAGGNQPPTADEATRFTQAYVAIFCTRQSGGGEDPRVTIQRHGLDVARYSEIEAYMARDDGRWRALTQAALAGCR